MKKFSAIIFLSIISISMQAQGYKVGDAASDFSLLNVDGKKISMADYKNAKGFVLIFTCNHCPFSQAYETRIIELDNKYASKGYPVIAINPNDENRVPEDSYENMKILAKERNFPFPYLRDETQETALMYGATRTPHVYILKKTGDKNIVAYVGAIDNNTEDPALADKKYAAEAIDALLEGKSVPTTETKAIGCTIKWKK